MIIKASQRGNAGALARHLMNAQDNDHITVHRIDRFVSDDIYGAFDEIEAISLGTRCMQPLFSVSFNPPKNETATIEDFESAIAEAAQCVNLENQPHVIIFHEKHGRLHAHAVWSRIKADEMKAIALPYFKNRLNALSKELYLKHGWDLPDGHRNKELRNPLNFTLAQWQHAKRLGDDPKAIKQALMECWQTSDSKDSLVAALDQQGFYLARGDRRGVVAVDWRGEIFSLSKWMGVKTKALKERLGQVEDLRGVDEVRNDLDQKLKSKLLAFWEQSKRRYQKRIEPYERRRADMVRDHDNARAQIKRQHDQQKEQLIRRQRLRFRRGVRGLWDRVTGKSRKMQDQNALTLYALKQKQQKERDKLLLKQIESRRELQRRFDDVADRYQRERSEIKNTVLKGLPEDKISKFQRSFDAQFHDHKRGYSLDM